MTLLHCNLRVALDRFVLHAEIDSSAKALGVFGPSGAGKTTLIEAVCGLSRAQGTLTFHGHHWLDSQKGIVVPPHERDIGYVPQRGQLFPQLDVRGNLSIGRKRAERTGHDFAKTFEQVVHVLELGPLLGARVDVLSGGERQRVALGRALCSGPRLLVLDEPLASLDLPLRRKLLPFLRRVLGEFHLPMLLVSHDPLEVQALCDEVVVLREGHVVSHGAPRSLAFVAEGRGGDLAEGFENVWPVIPESAAASTSVLRAHERTVIVRGRVGHAAKELLVSIDASSVLIATEAPVGLSAANVWPATLVEMKPRGDTMWLALDVDGAPLPLFAEVLTTTASRLGLELGSRVFAVVKSSSCRVFDERAP